MHDAAVVGSADSCGYGGFLAGKKGGKKGKKREKKGKKKGKKREKKGQKGNSRSRSRSRSQTKQISKFRFVAALMLRGAQKQGNCGGREGKGQ